MRRLARTVLVVIAVLSSACGDDDASTDETATGTRSEIPTIAAGKLTICSDIPYAPFEFEDEGELKGIDVDLVREIARKLDLEAEFRDTDFEGIFAALAAGTCDMIASSVSITEERKKENNFSDGYFAINQSLLVRKGDEGKYKDIPDLKGKRIGVQSETTGAEFATERASQAGVEIVEFTGADEVFTALKSGRVDGVVQDFPVNSYNAETTGETVVANVYTDAAEEEYGFVIPKKSTRLLEAVNEALGELRADGTYDRVIEQYLGEQADQPQGG